MRQALTGLGNSFRAALSVPALLAVAVLAGATPVQAGSKFAAIVIDANSGRTLYESSADAQRFPASLTKMMTLYLTFEAAKAGRISRTTRVPFSAECAAMPPTKLGIGAGKSVSVEQAILALVTKSANDAACALGELLGGSEPRFAKLMTAKARALGMRSTVFRNASGLPDPAQHTTARDMALLGVALREHFPQYYPYFSTRSFKFGRQRLANHNKLLGRVKGVDGIKTGYTRASGFNLVSSATDGKRRIVAVVMGGASGGARDNKVAALIEEYLPRASSRRGAAMVAAVEDAPVDPAAFAPEEEPAPLPESRPLAAVVEEPVVTTPKSGRVLPLQAPAQEAEPAPAKQAGVDPIKTAAVPDGWAIQVASSPSEVEARSALEKAGSKAGRRLASASPYTVPFRKGGTLFYRARFGGFGSKSAAWKACDALKKQGVACYAVEQ